MVSKIKVINQRRTRRKFRIRKSLHGTADRPRLSVFRSHKHIYCQLVDDDSRRTIASASSRDRGVRGDVTKTNKTETAQHVGKIVAARAKDAGVSQICFDRGMYKFHGRVRALAEAAREAGLSF
ncbi:MAG TPA: 50S ribosomal protein L18 [Pirellulaceae bacterium]